MAARLEVIAGNAAGTSIVVEDELVIGRHAEGPGRLADDDEISRSHARLTVEAGGTCAIEDLGSTNGTFVNGMRLSAPRTLGEGDTIELGGTTLIVREVTRPAPARGLQPTVVPGAPSPVPSEAIPPDVEEPPTAVRPPGGVEPPPPVPAPAPPAAQAPAEPAPPPEAPVATPPTEAPVAAPPPLSLRLTVDFVAREAMIALDGGSEPVRLIFEDGVWRAAPKPPSQEG